VCTQLGIHINTTFTEMRFEALQNQTSSNLCHWRKSHTRLRNHTIPSSRTAQQIATSASGLLQASCFPEELLPWKANHKFLLVLKAESPLLGVRAVLVKLTDTQVRAATAVFLRAAGLMGFSPRWGGNILWHARGSPFLFW